ncbi:hypothetical protein [Agromyces sp. NPDC058126]|uniref:hypothetical protein n=1 Tax=Agromyces sp. NPDC058126 TaxID=3346350 RepID=UPI0036D9E326
MFEGFGKSHHHYLRIERNRPLEAYVDDAVRVIDRSNTRSLIEQWDREDHPRSRPGRKPQMAELTVIALMLIQARIDSDMRWVSLNRTMIQLTVEQQRAIWAKPDPDGNWYHVLRRAYQRLEPMIDAYPGQRKVVPDAAQYRRTVAARDEKKMAIRRNRFNELIDGLLDATFNLQPRWLRRASKGNIVQDATRFAMYGARGNPLYHDLESDRTSINFDAGRYKRGGDHDGSTSKKSKTEWALEAEIAIMAKNEPGKPAEFPLMILGYDFHVPGEIKGAAIKMVESLHRRGYQAGLYISDRAYAPYGGQELMECLADHNYHAVFDYKLKDRGTKGSAEAARAPGPRPRGTSSRRRAPAVIARADNAVERLKQNEHVIIVAGSPYLAQMPEHLQDAHLLYTTAKQELKARGLPKAAYRKAKAAEKSLLAQRLLEREVYRLRRRGTRRSDGSQQYSYPSPDDYGLLIDATTGEIVDPPKQKTVVIPRKIECRLQLHSYDSDAWKAHYGLRNTVEGVNNMLKGEKSTDIGNARKRAPRGNTFSALTVGLSLVALNLQKLLAFFRERLAKKALGSANALDFTTYYSEDDLRDMRRRLPSPRSDEDPPPQQS